MINLIPNKEKKEMRKGFYFRLVVLFLVMGSVSILIALVAVLPAYFFSSMKSRFINDKLEAQSKEPVPLPDQETLAIIKDLDKKLDLLERQKGKQFIVSERVIGAIVQNKMPSIKITDITYEDNKDKGRKISIQGTAPSREVLLLFRKALEDDTAFKSVDLPISNFIKGSNIQFFLSLIPS